MLCPRPSSWTAPSIWYDAVLVPKTNPSGSRGRASSVPAPGLPSPMLRIVLPPACQDRCMTIDVRRAADRPVTREDGRVTSHSFSFGAHYDPANVGFGLLTAHNEDRLQPGAGYPEHRHSDVEIVTVVLDGALRHRDSAGNSNVLVPGEVSRTSAGSGFVHAELSEPEVPTRFVQAWLRPDEPGGDPSYAVAAVGRPWNLAEVVGSDGPVGIGARGAHLFLATPAPGAVALPEAPHLHVFVADGRAVLGDRQLAAGDAARLTGEGGRLLVVETSAVLLVWAFDR